MMNFLYNLSALCELFLILFKQLSFFFVLLSSFLCRKAILPLTPTQPHGRLLPLQSFFGSMEPVRAVLVGFQQSRRKEGGGQTAFHLKGVSNQIHRHLVEGYHAA